MKAGIKINPEKPLNNNAASNKSMDVRAKQRLSYQRPLITFSLRVGGFAPRHLSRSTFSFFC